LTFSGVQNPLKEELVGNGVGLPGTGAAIDQELGIGRVEDFEMLGRGIEDPVQVGSGSRGGIRHSGPHDQQG